MFSEQNKNKMEPIDYSRFEVKSCDGSTILLNRKIKPESHETYLLTKEPTSISKSEFYDHLRELEKKRQEIRGSRQCINLINFDPSELYQLEAQLTEMQRLKEEIEASQKPVSLIGRVLSHF